MRLGLAQEFEAVRREIDDEDAPAGRQKLRRLAQRPRRIVEVMQHLMDDDEIERAARRRAARRCRPAGARPRTPARSRLARATDSMAWLASRPTARPAPGPSSCSMRPVPVPRSSRLWMGLDPSASRMARLDERPPAPAASGSGPIRARAGRRIPAPLRRAAGARRRAASRSSASAVIGAVECGEHGPQDRGAGPSSVTPEEGPGSFAVALDELRLDEKLQVARDARLRLAEDVGQIGHRQLALGEQRQDAQARLLGGGPQGAERLVQGGCAVGQFGTPEEI